MPQLDTSLRCTERSGAWYNENSSKSSSQRGLMPITMYFCSLLASGSHHVLEVGPTGQVSCSGSPNLISCSASFSFLLTIALYIYDKHTNPSLLLFCGLGLVRCVLGWPDSRPNGCLHVRRVFLIPTVIRRQIASAEEQQESRRLFLGHVRSESCCHDYAVAEVTCFRDVLRRVSSISDAGFEVSSVRLD